MKKDSFAKKNKDMATITLEYDARNTVAKRFVEFISTCGIFSIVNDKNKSETLQALKDAKSGKNIVKPKDPIKFIDECMK